MLPPVAGRNRALNNPTTLASVKCLPAHFNADKARPVSTKCPDTARLNAKFNALRASVFKTAERTEVDAVALTPRMLRAI
jgi:hypothetical protein